MNVEDIFRRIVSHLDQHKVPYMLVGSFAGTYYGASRSTRDIDIVIDSSPQQLSAFIADLQRDHYYAELDAALEAHKDESLFNVIDNQTGWKIDLITRKSRAFSREEFQRRRSIVFSGIALSIASPEDTVISKLEWAKLAGSQRQIEDSTRILSAQWESMDKAYLKRWIRELELNAQWEQARMAAGITT
jgi:predicted nucleotidyltransferase